MNKCLLVSTIGALAFASFSAAQQTTTPNSDHSDVFLDNHRPLTNKKTKAPTSRNLAGKVVDDNGQPLQGALVTLTDEKTKQKTTVITKQDGRYSFDDLSFTNDYQVDARYKGLVSEPRKLSQYDRSVNVVRILQVGDQPKASSSSGSAARKEAPPEVKK